MHALDVTEGGRTARAVVLTCDEHAAFIRLSRCMRRRLLRECFQFELAGAKARATEDGGVVFWRWKEAFVEHAQSSTSQDHAPALPLLP